MKSSNGQIVLQRHKLQLLTLAALILFLCNVSTQAETKVATNSQKASVDQKAPAPATKAQATSWSWLKDCPFESFGKWIKMDAVSCPLKAAAKWLKNWEGKMTKAVQSGGDYRFTN